MSVEQGGGGANARAGSLGLGPRLVSYEFIHVRSELSIENLLKRKLATMVMTPSTPLKLNSSTQAVTWYGIE